MCFFAKSQPGVYTVLEYQNLLFHKILETEALQKKVGWEDITINSSKKCICCIVYLPIIDEKLSILLSSVLYSSIWKKSFPSRVMKVKSHIKRNSRNKKNVNIVSGQRSKCFLSNAIRLINGCIHLHKDIKGLLTLTSSRYPLW